MAFPKAFLKKAAKKGKFGAKAGGGKKGMPFGVKKPTAAGTKV